MSEYKTTLQDQREYELRGILAITPASFANPFRKEASDLTGWILKKAKKEDAKFIKIMRRIELLCLTAYEKGKQDVMSKKTNIEKACYLHDKGWLLAEHRQDGNHQYTITGGRNVPLQTAWEIQRSVENGDQHGFGTD